ncbi:10880_t:CDS:2 [Racocetra fulgida]|uniref:10880_t:CDS:1 n=1 Tax=Racocetra fulgida TaxID=60492 RepID=A0A9N8VM31_9GLOM|nr:10880_t:CDS:2 [Racocetra fulgida]
MEIEGVKYYREEIAKRDEITLQQIKEVAEPLIRKEISQLKNENVLVQRIDEFLADIYICKVLYNADGLKTETNLRNILRREKFGSKDYDLAKVTNFRFRDVGGCQEAKEELKEIVAFLRNPQLFQQSGAKLPKGVLLVGPHGNGKTLLGKALAGECQLPFLFRSGSEFEEMVVGLGARRIRELFAEARSYPNGCIIFIDEIDSIGRRRNTHNSNDLTLNQLLNELDGFNPRENIFILAATNFPQVLDAALLRPGRFDRQIFITLPNLQARREIIKLATPKIPFRQDVDLEEVASLTRGFSGAQIVNLFNEATLLCLRYNHKKISQEHIFEAHDRVLMGPSSLSHTIHPSKKKIVAFHEAGHAIIGLSLPETSVKKITVVPR